MGMPKMPRPGPAPNEAPNLLDPTVMFARKRERQRSLMAAGRQSTILASGHKPPASLLNPAPALTQQTSPPFKAKVY